eukprot:TRINITY_DN9142_c0_g1_i3.p1 TRINITY_DN9142_c0_g1~~TRINITY_DN9142_c0_g1_i3.p1  ORF type:complete len:760 (+),score=154.98 TRINITY_DN9142_c0_g1_i3:78-2282(+)
MPAPPASLQQRRAPPAALASRRPRQGSEDSGSPGRRVQRVPSDDTTDLVTDSDPQQPTVLRSPVPDRRGGARERRSTSATSSIPQQPAQPPAAPGSPAGRGRRSPSPTPAAGCALRTMLAGGRRGGPPWCPPDSARSCTPRPNHPAPEPQRRGSPPSGSRPVTQPRGWAARPAAVRASETPRRRSSARRGRQRVLSPAAETSDSSSVAPTQPMQQPRRAAARPRSSSYTAGSGRRPASARGTVALRAHSPERSRDTSVALQDGGSLRMSELSAIVPADLNATSTSTLVHQCAMLQRKAAHLEELREADRQLAQHAKRGGVPDGAALELLEAQEQRLERMYLGNLALERRLRNAEQGAEEHKQRADDAEQQQQQLRARVAELTAELATARRSSGARQSSAGASPSWLPSGAEEGGDALQRRLAECELQLAGQRQRAEDAEALLRRNRQRVAELEREVERLRAGGQEPGRSLAGEQPAHWADVQSSPRPGGAANTRGAAADGAEVRALRERVRELERDAEKHREVRVGLRQEITELTRRLAAAPDGVAPGACGAAQVRALAGSALGASSSLVTPPASCGSAQWRQRSPGVRSEGSSAVASSAAGGRAWAEPAAELRQEGSPQRPARRTASPRPAAGLPSPRPREAPVGVGSVGARTPRESRVHGQQVRVGDWVWSEDGAQHGMVVEVDRHAQPPACVLRFADGREARTALPPGALAAQRSLNAPGEYAMDGGDRRV